MTDSVQPSVPMVRFGRRQQRGFLLGFSASRVACIAGAVAVFTLSLFIGGVAGVAVMATVWVGLLVAGIRPLG